MRIRQLCVLTAVCLFITGAAHGATKYKLDGTHSHVGFAVEHFSVARMVCSFGKISGAIMYDVENLSNASVEIVIDATTLTSEFQDRIDAVKSEFFLDVGQYPEITFKSKKITKNDKGYHVVGDLTVHGTTKEVEFPLELVGPVVDPWGNDRIGVSAMLTINRLDYGITFDRKLKDGSPFIGDDVDISFSVEAIPAE